MENHKITSKYNRAKRKMERLKSFYSHLSIFAIINLTIIAFKVYDSLDSWDSFIYELLTFNTLSTLIVWGSILCIHTFVVFVLPRILGYDWEERKIERFMQEELNSKN